MTLPCTFIGARRARAALTTLAVTGSLMIMALERAYADDWGCQVLLCMSDSRGAEAESACVPPIEQLWRALRHGHAFPSCDLNSSMSDLPPALQEAVPSLALASLAERARATYTQAGVGYCRPDALYWGGHEQSELMCSESGAINVMVDGELLTRVWWNGGGSFTEYYGPGANAVAYDPSTSAQQFLKSSSGVESSTSSGNH